MKRWLNRIFRPCAFYNAIGDIPLDRLIEAGITHILIDLDGTLTWLGHHRIEQWFLEWIDEAKSHFDIALVTCNHERRNMEHIARQVNIPSFQRKFWERPGSFFWRVDKELGLTGGKTAIINDSLIILGLFGRRLGYYTIKVDSIEGDVTHSPIGWIYIIGQWFERTFIQKYLARS